MTAVLTVHIGCAKGGSSAIQRFLRQNVDALRRRGIVVPTVDLEPGSVTLGHQLDFFQSTVSGGRAHTPEGLEQKLLALVDDDVEDIVISAENLCNPVGFEKVIGELLPSFEVRVLMYVRRQDDYLESAWQQWYVKEGRSLLSWMIENVGTVADWGRWLEPWTATVGEEAMTVRLFDRKALVGGDVVEDFCQYIGVDSSGLRLGGPAANPSFDSRIAAVVDGRPELFGGMHDHSFYDMLRDLTGDRALKAPGSPRLFTTEERATIMAQYAASNERLRLQYMPDVEPPLFGPPKEAPTLARTDLADYERELLQLQIQGLYQRLTALERDEG